MPTVTLTPATDTKVHVRVVDSGVPVFDQRVSRASDAGQRRIAAAAGMTQTQVLVRLAQMDDAQGPLTFDTGPAAPPAGPFTIRYRGLREPDAAAAEYTADTPRAAITYALTTALAGAERPELVLRWDGTDALACLDVDYHHVAYRDRPAPAELDWAGAMVHPQPVARHASHGRGYKLYYVAADGFGADELAAAAGLAWRQRDGRATFEIKATSRHPMSPRPGPEPGREELGGEVHLGTGDADAPAVARWLGRAADPARVDEWLAEHGLRRGQTYSHDWCPIAAWHVSKSPAPVAVLEHGLFCHSCAGAGRAYGSRRKPGFVPWAGLVGGLGSEVYDLVRHFVHWAHAKHFVRFHIGGAPDPVLRLAYRTALKLVHGAHDPRIDMAFVNPQRELILVTTTGWALNDGKHPVVAKNLKPILAELPALQTCTRSETGRVLEVKPYEAQIAVFSNPDTDLSRYGYRKLTPIFGSQVWGRHLDYPDGVTPFLLPNPKVPDHRQPKYVPKSRRPASAVAGAWALLEDYFPGISADYVKLLIAAKGCVEGGGEMVHILASGVSSAGKSNHVDIATSIYGGVPAAMNWEPDHARFQQAVHASVRDGAELVRVDEYRKASQKLKIDVRAALNPVLTLTPDTKGHVLYVGQIPLGRPVALIWTDIERPEDVTHDVQLSRRMVGVHLSRRVEWKAPCVRRGLASPGFFRAHADDAAEACDVILSEVIDEFFREPPAFRDIAERLGFPVLEKAADAGCGGFDPDADCAPGDQLGGDPAGCAPAGGVPEDPRGGIELTMKRLFNAVCKAPPLTGQHADRYGANTGWKVVSREPDADNLSAIWAMVNDVRATGDWHTSRRTSEVDWGLILMEPGGVWRDVRFQARPYPANAPNPRYLYVRFRAGKGRAPDAVNQQIRPVYSLDSLR